jgi:hypothetical protein
MKQPFLIGEISSKSAKFKNSKFKNEVILEMFHLHKKVRKNNLKIWQISIIGFSLCSQKYRRMIKDLYFIFDL